MTTIALLPRRLSMSCAASARSRQFVAKGSRASARATANPTSPSKPFGARSTSISASTAHALPRSDCHRTDGIAVRKTREPLRRMAASAVRRISVGEYRTRAEAISAAHALLAAASSTNATSSTTGDCQGSRVSSLIMTRTVPHSRLSAAHSQHEGHVTPRRRPPESVDSPM